MKKTLMKLPSSVANHGQLLQIPFSKTSSNAFQNNLTPTTPSLKPFTLAKNATFESVLLAYIRNSRYYTPTTPKPWVIVTAKHESHVQATVICAKWHGLQIRIRSGGHDYEGLSYVSYVPFVILDMFNLRTIHIDVADESAWVESGAIVGELYYEIAKKSKVHGFSAATGPTVGVGGHFSGAGYGVMLRKYGLTVDNIEDAKLVNVNGTILDRKSMGEDLFWAIRGGGGASFGVILSWKIKLLPVPAKVTVFNIGRTLEQGASDVLYRWQHVAPNLPKEVFIRAMPQVLSTSLRNNTLEVSFIGFFLGQSDELLSLINGSLPELGLQKTDCFEMSWVESTVFWDDHPLGTSIDVLLERPRGPDHSMKGKSDYVKEPIPKQDIEYILKELLKMESGWMQWSPYGGRMSEISEWATPFPHRAGNLFMIQYSWSWEEEGIEATNKYLSLSRNFHKIMTPFVSKRPREAFQNYRDLDIGANLDNQTIFNIARVYGSKYFEGNFERLVRVKTEVDPQNFFKHEQSIPPLPQYYLVQWY
ncbi:putative tetrahydroberberine oxidase [Rosa chinensis]|uniref:Putative tetrahydroberberine oxidase n=1 Tax=Rosa chinensis TaxID=74649 RepID=A0A2P6Q6L0_ROSCH|nr:putative tetrahydroberberine oxidase [Rosa chinensis]